MREGCGMRKQNTASRKKSLYKLIIGSFIVLSVFSLFGVLVLNQYSLNFVSNNKQDNNILIEYEISLTLPVDHAILVKLYDSNNLSTLVGYVDYVFLGRIESFERTNYDYSIDKDGNIIDSINPMPSSVFRVKVIENLKNMLNDNVEVIRVGGLRKDGKSVVMIGETTLPEIGGIYFFYAIAQRDGTLVLTGEDIHADFDIEIDKSESNVSFIKSIAQNTEKYNKVINAIKSEIIYDRPRYLANDDLFNG